MQQEALAEQQVALAEQQVALAVQRELQVEQKLATQPLWKLHQVQQPDPARPTAHLQKVHQPVHPQLVRQQLKGPQQKELQRLSRLDQELLYPHWELQLLSKL